MFLGTVEGDRGAAQGLEPDGPSARQASHLVAPRTRRVDDGGDAVDLSAGLDLPGLTRLFDPHDFRAGTNGSSSRSQSAEEALQRPCDVDASRPGLQETPGHVVLAQDRAERARARAVQQAHIDAELLSGLALRRQALSLVRPPDEEDGPREHQRVGREALRRLLEEAAARLRQASNDGVAVALYQDRSGASRGVMTRKRLALEEDHPAMGLELMGYRRTGDPGADDGEVGVPHCQICRHTPSQFSPRIPRISLSR